MTIAPNQIILATDLRNERATAIKNKIDSGGHAGTLELYAADNTLIARCALSYPCGSVNNGILTFATINAGLILVTGTIAYGNFVSSGNFLAMQAGAGAEDSDAIIKSNVIDAIKGGKINISSAAFLEANA